MERTFGDKTKMKNFYFGHNKRINKLSKYDYLTCRTKFTKKILQMILGIGISEFTFDVCYDRIKINTKFYNSLVKEQLEIFYVHYIDFHIDLTNRLLVIMIPEKIRKL